MKKILIVIVLLVIVFSGCGSDSDDNNKSDSKNASVAGNENNAKKNSDSAMIEITEKLFVGQVNDIYINTDDYIGQTIKYEGLVKTYPLADGSEVKCVIRYGPGCCGTDGDCGFEIAYDDEMPADDEWVEVVGDVETFEEDGISYIRVKASSVKVLKERGAETVTQ